MKLLDKIMVRILERKHYVHIRKDGDNWRVDLSGKSIVTADLFTLDEILEKEFGEND